MADDFDDSVFDEICKREAYLKLTVAEMVKLAVLLNIASEDDLYKTDDPESVSAAAAARKIYKTYTTGLSLYFMRSILRPIRI